MDDAETAVWAEICAVQEKLVELKQSLNRPRMSRSIFTLPPDILLKIFVLLIDHTRFSKDPTKEARHATQVCHQWRDMALASATLWVQNLDCNRNSRALFAKLLERAGSAPINVVANFHKGSSVYLKTVDNLNAALSRSCRFTSVSLVGPPWNLEGAFQQAVARMERISLTRIQLALELFQEHNDHIKSLQLLECGNLGVLSLPTCRNLTELAISGPLTRHSVWQAVVEGLSIGEWLHYLGSLTQLQSLSILMNAIREDASNDGPFPDVELKHLSMLSLAGTAQQRIDKLLGHIATPGGCSLSLSYEKNPTGPLQGELLNAITRWFGRWPESNVSNVTNILYSPKTSHSRIHNKPSDGPPPRLSFRIVLGSDGLSFPIQVLKTMESITSKSTTLVFWVYNLNGVWGTNLLCGISNLEFPKVRTLHFVETENNKASHLQPFQIADALGMVLGFHPMSRYMTRKTDEMGQLRTLFPELRRIHIGKVTISVD